MKVELARIAGFCMGVRRAVDMALSASNGGDRPVYTYGPLIHNPSVLALLDVRGVKVLRHIPACGEGMVIIRAHGVPPGDKERLISAGFDVIDATCPRVVKVQMLARHYSAKGFWCVLAGDRGHPEVVGIMGHAEEGRCILVDSEGSVGALGLSGPYVILAQTTQDEDRFDRLSGLIMDRYPDGRVFNTICDSTHRRQEEARRLAMTADAVVVVGGRQSANTRRLAGIVEECGKTAIAVETEDDLDRKRLAGFRRIGVTAGASTPNWVINKVAREIEATPGVFEPVWRRVAYRSVRFLHESSLCTAMAGGALAWAAAVALGSSLVPAIPVSFLYIFAMHTLNRLIDREAGAYNDPLRVRFLVRHKSFFFGASLIAILASLVMALGLGFRPFLMLLILTCLGIFYAAPVIPAGLRRKALKDLPGSKALFVSIAWAAVSVIVPAAARPFEPVRLAWFALACAFVYLRTALMELLDVQGDRIVGKESLVIAIGEAKTLQLIRTGAVALAISGLFLSILGQFSWRPVAFLPASLWLYYLSRFFSGARIRENLKLEFMVESGFFILLFSVVVMSAWG